MSVSPTSCASVSDRCCRSCWMMARKEARDRLLDDLEGAVSGWEGLESRPTERTSSAESRMLEPRLGDGPRAASRAVTYVATSNRLAEHDRVGTYSLSRELLSEMCRDRHARQG